MRELSKLECGCKVFTAQPWRIAQACEVCHKEFQEIHQRVWQQRLKQRDEESKNGKL